MRSSTAPAQAVDAKVTVRVQRTGAAAKFVGQHRGAGAGQRLGARTRSRSSCPSGLSRGNYYLAACTPSGPAPASSAARRRRRTSGSRAARRSAAAPCGCPRRAAGATAAQAETCTSGAHTLAKPGERVYPEHRQQRLRQPPQRRLHQLRRAHQPVPAGHARRPAAALDAVPERLQPRLRPAQLDHQHDRPGAGLHRRLDHGQRPAGDVQVRPADLPGRSQRPGRSRPAGAPHRPGDADQRRQPEPAGVPADVQRRPRSRTCRAVETKLVITPSAPIPSGTDFNVTVNYTGRPGVRPSPTGTEGWFRNNTAGGQGAMVTSEPTGTEAWMPLNNHPSVKPTYDIYDTVTKGKLAIGPGRLISSGDNAADANFADRLDQLPLEVVGADRELPGREQRRQLRLLVPHRRQRRRLLRGPGLGDHRRAQGAQPGRDGPAGGDHALPGVDHRAVPVQLQRHRRRAPARELRGGDADEDRLRRRHDRRRPGHEHQHVRAREHAPVVGRQRRRGRAQADVVQGGPGDDGRVLPDRADRGQRRRRPGHRGRRRGVRGEPRRPASPPTTTRRRRRSGTPRRRTRRR